MKFEEILPEIRKGRKARRAVWVNGTFHTNSHWGLKHVDILADDWELVPEPIRVADYFVPRELYNIDCYVKRTHPIGQQPEGAVLVPNTERDQA